MEPTDKVPVLPTGLPGFTTPPVTTAAAVKLPVPASVAPVIHCHAGGVGQLAVKHQGARVDRGRTIVGIVGIRHRHRPGTVDIQAGGNRREGMANVPVYRGLDGSGSGPRSPP